jgi:hypothetical protein
MAGGRTSLVFRWKFDLYAGTSADPLARANQFAFLRPVKQESGQITRVASIDCPDFDPTQLLAVHMQCPGKKVYPQILFGAGTIAQPSVHAGLVFCD